MSQEISSKLYGILTKVSPDFDQSCYEQVNKKSNWSQILLYLFDQIGFKMVELKSLLENVIQQCLNGKNVDRKTDSSLKEAFIKIKLIQGGGLTNKKQIRDILKFSSNSTTTLGCIQDMVKSIPCLAEFNSQEFCQMVEEDRQYEYFRIQAPKVEPNPQSFPARVADKTEKVQKQAEEIKSKLAAIEKSIQTMKDSVLDQHIQLHLIDALKQKLRRLTDKNEGMQEQLYNKQKYNGFKTRLAQILKQFSLMSSEISKELEEDTPSLDFYQKILKIRSKIHYIYLPQLFQLKEKNDLTQQTVNDKQIITILGVTGAGKSTAVQMLLGYQMELVEMNEVSGELTTLMPIGGLKEQHKDFISRASQCSTTKHTSAVEIQYQTSNYTTQKLFLVDTPGFFDTGGVIVDTCNALSTIQVLKSANSIRFIFLLNQKNWGTKGQGFKNMVSMISRLFKQYYPQKIIYFLNCFHEKQLKELPLKVRDLKANLTPVQKGDTKFTQIVNHFDDLMSKAQQLAREKNITIKEAIEMSQQIIVMDPLQPNKNKIMKIIGQQRKQIKQIEQQLQDILSQQSRQAISSQIDLLRKIIEKSIQKNKGITGSYYLGLLQKLNLVYIEKGDTQSKASKIVQELKNELKLNFQKNRKEFHQLLQKIQSNAFFDNDKLNDLQNSRQQILKKQKIYGSLFPKQFPEEFQQNMNVQIQRMLERMDKAYKQNEREYIFHKICAISAKFEKDQKMNKRIKQEMKEKLAYLTNKIKDNIQENNYKQIQKDLDNIKKIEQLLQSVQPQGMTYKKSDDDWKQLLSKSLQIKQTKCIQILKDKALDIDQLKEVQFTQIRSILQIFSSVLNPKTQELKNVVDAKQRLVQLIKKVTRDCLNFLKRYIKEEDSILEENTYKKFQIVQKNINLLLQNFKEYCGDVKYIYQVQQANLSNLIGQKSQTLDYELQNLEKSSPQAFKKIYLQVKSLSRLTAFCGQDDKQILIQTVKQFENKMQTYLEDKIRRIDNINSIFDAPFRQIQKLFQLKRKCECVIKTKRYPFRSKKQSGSSNLVEDFTLKNCQQALEKFKKIYEKMIKEVNEQMSTKSEQLKKGKNNMVKVLKNVTKIDKFLTKITAYTKAQNIISQTEQQDLNDIKERFAKFVINTINQKRQESKQMYEKLRKKIEIYNDDQLIEYHELYQLRQIKQMWENLQSAKRVGKLIQNLQIQPDEDDFIKTQCTEFQSSIQKTFERLKKDDSLYLCARLIQDCRRLAFLDIKGMDRISSLSRTLNDQLNEKCNWIKDNNINCIQKDGSFNPILFRKKMQFSYKLHRSKDIKFDMRKDMQEVSIFIRKQEKKFIDMINTAMYNDNHFEQKQYMTMVFGIRKLYDNHNEVKKILSGYDNLNYQFDIIQEDLEQNIVKYFLRIFDSLILEGKKFQSNSDYENVRKLISQAKDIEVLIKKMENEKCRLDIKKGINETLKQKYESGIKNQYEYLSQFYENFIQQKIALKKQKYFGQSIQFSEDLLEDYSSFNQAQKKNLKICLNRYFSKNITQIQKQFHEQTMRNTREKLQQLINNFKFIPADLKQENQTNVKKLKDQLEKANQERLSQISANLKLQNFIQLLSVDRNRKSKQIQRFIFQKVDEFYREQLEIMERQKQTKAIIHSIKSKYINIMQAKFADQELDKLLKRNRQKLVKFLELFLQKKYQEFIRQFKLHSKKINTSLASLLQLIEFIQYSNDYFKFCMEEPKNLRCFFQRQLLEQQKNQFPSTLSELSPIKKKVFARYQFKRTCEQTMRVIKSFHKINSTEIRKTYQLIQSYLEVQNKNYSNIKKQINDTVKEIQSFDLFKKDLYNIGEQERKNHFSSFEDKVKIIGELVQFGILFQQDYKQKIQEKQGIMVQQISNNIEKMSIQLKKLFNQIDYEFNRQINVTLIVLKSIKTNFLRLNDQLKIKFAADVSSSLQGIQNKISAQFQTLLDKKNTWKEEENKFRKNIENRMSMRVKQLKNQTDKNIKNFEQINIANMKDSQIQQEQKQRLKKQCENNIELKRRQERQQSQQYQQLLNQQLKKKMEDMQHQKVISLQSYCQYITIFYKILSELHIPEIAAENSLSLKQLVKQINDNINRLGNKFGSSIFKILKEMKNNYSNIIIDSCQAFQKIKISQWNAKIKGNGIDYVLGQFKGDKSQKQKLKQNYLKYESSLTESTKEFQAKPSQTTIQLLINNIKSQGKEHEKYYFEKGNSTNFKPCQLIGKIFSLWTISKSSVQDENVELYYQPHPAQISTVFLLLSIIQQPRKLKNAIAQVNTGEGKSVILAGLSCYLALCGFQVCCACFSVYLSQRDKKSFADLFEMLGVKDKISYGTFQSVCQNLLNSINGQSKGLRQDVKLFLNQGNQKYQKILDKCAESLRKLKQQGNRKVLLIDQIDVFFDPTFFGSIYSPDAYIESNEISALIKFVWQKYKEKGKSLMPAQIIQSKAYKNVQNKYRHLKKLLLHQVNGMILGCLSVKHSYIVHEDLIKYKDQDGISSKINYGYQTLFAYFKQHDSGRISSKSLEKALKISLVIAEFSYAELPKYFRNIFGVTGTYQSLPQFKKQYMKLQYKFERSFLIPSVYGTQNRRRIQDPIVAQTGQQLFLTVEEIQKIHQNGNGRPILVFFKSNLELQGLYNLPQYKQLRSATTFLNETHIQEDRDNRIKRVCRRGNITFMTSAFGRGTDFLIYDEQILKIGEGGLHIIHTFLAIEQNEEIQIQGRTARQGNPGSYKLIISKSQLQPLRFNYQKVHQQKDKFYDELSKCRKLKSLEVKQSVQQKIQNCKNLHQVCSQIYCNDSNKVMDYIENLNLYPEVKQLKHESKTVIMIDGTASMRTPLSHLLNALSQILTETLKVLEQSKSKKTIYFQICVYRNYNCNMQKLLQYSDFSNNSKVLVSFLKRINPEGGWGNEAIEVGFWHLNNIPDVHQCIVIGDARANFEKQAIAKRGNIFKQEYWSKYLPPLSSDRELQKIKEKKIPIHSLYIKSNIQVQKYFNQISKETNGKSQQFDPSSKEAKKLLSDFIGERVLECTAENNDEAEKMKVLYRKRNSK